MVIRICSKCRRRYEDLKAGSYGYPYLCDRCKKKKEKFSFIIAFIFMLIAGILIILSINSISAEKVNQQTYLVQSCNNCTFCNITKITDPAKAIVLTNLEMTKDGASYNYTLYPSYLNSSGEYCWWYYCGNTVESATGKICFDVSIIGKEFDLSKAITYVLIFFISFVMFIGLLVMGIALPVSNKRDEMTGYIFAVNNLKYFKMLCLGLAYMVAVFMSYFSWSITYAYLDMEFVSKIFYFVFISLVVLILPLFIFSAYLTITNMIRDNKVHEALTRGLRIR